jgi:threonine synthase
MKITLQCTVCQKQYRPSAKIWRCPCKGFLTIKFHARFPLKKIKTRKPTLWRYREALPIISNNNIVTFHEGFTPLVEEPFFGKTVLLKQDQLFPSGSYKDRGATVLVSKMRELGIKKVVEDSSGNAGAALAAYCAKAHIQCHIYTPEKTSSEKLIQIQQYGAHLHQIPGTREDVAKVTLQIAQTSYYASHTMNPYFIHGTKTYIFEIVEQLGWKPPDILLIPVGNGTLLYGTYLGLQELLHENVIDTLPKIIGVQAENCAPLAYMWKTQKEIHTYKPLKETIAEGIAIRNPLRAKEIISAVKQTKGSIITVTEKEILNALRLASQKGYYIEPTSAVALAGLKTSLIKNGKITVVPLTGHGLKASGILKNLK